MANVSSRSAGGFTSTGLNHRAGVLNDFPPRAQREVSLPDALFGL